jgi:hypothetical protein
MFGQTPQPECDVDEHGAKRGDKEQNLHKLANLNRWLLAAGFLEFRQNS